MRGPWAFLIFAVAPIVMVTGLGPQENRMTPPAATADTTALDVQLPGVPFPITLVACEVSTARAAAGTAAWPSGLPCRNGLGLGFFFDGDGLGVGEIGGERASGLCDGPASAEG
ncbi:hypothetical protein GCM10027176_44720 [Actinoallomurus bryophytorum]